MFDSPFVHFNEGTAIQATVNQQVRPRLVGRTIAQPTAIESAQTTKLDIAMSLSTVWRETWFIVVTHALPMFSFVLIGLFGVALIGTMGTTLGNGEQRQLFDAFELRQYGTMIAYAIGSLLAHSFACGGISWLALQGEDTTVGLAAACRATFKRLPALMFGTLVYGAVITTGAVGLGLTVRYARLDMAPVVRVPGLYTLNPQMYVITINVVKSVVDQSPNALIPDPGAPFSAWLTVLRTTILTRMLEVQSPLRDSSSMGTAYRIVPIFRPDEREFWWITVGSAALILLAETLLCLRTATVMNTDHPSIFGPIWQSLRLGSKHYRLITIHVWLLRLIFVVFRLLFVIVPVAFIQEAMLPKMLSALPQFWLGARPLIWQTTALCLSLVGAAFNAFSVLYDARLYLLLATRADTVDIYLKMQMPPSFGTMA